MNRSVSSLIGLLLALTGCATGIDRDLVAARTGSLYGDRPTAPVAATEREAPPDAAADGSLDGYIRIALLNNAGLRSAFEQWRSALERIPQVTALPDPQFTYTNFIEEVQTRTGPQNNRFQLSQKFPWFGKLKAQGDVAAARGQAQGGGGEIEIDKQERPRLGLGELGGHGGAHRPTHRRPRSVTG